MVAKLAELAAASLSKEHGPDPEAWPIDSGLKATLADACKAEEPKPAEQGQLSSAEYIKLARKSEELQKKLEAAKRRLEAAAGGSHE